MIVLSDGSDGGLVGLLVVGVGGAFVGATTGAEVTGLGLGALVDGAVGGLPPSPPPVMYNSAQFQNCSGVPTPS